MNTRLIASFVIVAGVLSGCASSRGSYPAASPPTYPNSAGSVVTYPDGYYVLRGDNWEWVQRARASSPAPEAPFTTQ
jgi:hypothetical protein